MQSSITCALFDASIIAKKDLNSSNLPKQLLYKYCSFSFNSQGWFSYSILLYKFFAVRTVVHYHLTLVQTTDPLINSVCCLSAVCSLFRSLLKSTEKALFEAR
jgi:hypothetical protein